MEPHFLPLNLVRENVLIKALWPEINVLMEFAIGLAMNGMKMQKAGESVQKQNKKMNKANKKTI